MGVALAHPLPEAVIEQIARRFRVLSEPIRIRLLELLREREATVTDLVGATGTTQQNVSKHLGVLLQAGMVARRKEGTASYYSIADESVFRLCEDVCGTLERQVGQLGELLAESRT